jgi:predicted unusual protein kinase regulating ubiquinone biosynthesis (AarF/ABC1/UbiB family)
VPAVEEADPTGDGVRLHTRHLPVPTRTERARRGAQITAVLARRLGPVLAGEAAHRRHGAAAIAAAARPLRLAFEDLGGTFVKFGQLVASSPGLFGAELAEEFRSCLDTGPVVPYHEVASLVEDELGMRVDEAFDFFDPVPVGRASIAVVHRARLHDGRDVAVKVLRPGIDHRVATDLSVMEPLFELLSRWTGAQLAGATLQQLDGLRLQVGEELDLRNEGRALASFGRLVASSGFDALVVPEPVPERSSASVLTMAYLDGVPIDDLESARAFGVDPAPLVDQLIRSFFTFVVRERVFHGDVHAGNLLLLRDGRLGLLDWGIVGRLDERTHRFVLRLLAAVLGDEQAWRDVTAYLVDIYGGQLRDAMKMDDEQLTAFLRSMVEPVLLRPFGEFSLGELMVAAEVRAAEAYGIELRRQGVRGSLQRLRLQRRLRRAAEEGGGLMSEFDRTNFLLGKQLMYFERYGKLFLADAPILGDRDFVAGLLAEQGEHPPDAA